MASPAPVITFMSAKHGFPSPCNYGHSRYNGIPAHRMVIKNLCNFVARMEAINLREQQQIMAGGI